MRIHHSAFLCLATVASTTSAFTPGHRTTALSSSSFLARQETALRLDASDVANTMKNAFEVIDGGLKNVVNNLDNINLAVHGKTTELLRDLLTQVQIMMGEGRAVQQEFMKYFTTFSKEIDQWLTTQNPQMESLFRQIVDNLSALSINTPETIGIAAVITFFVINSILTWDEAPPPSKPYPLQRYDPVAAQAYFDGRGLEFVSRALEIAIKSLRFGLQVLQDQIR
jgi:hypothetical protein